MPEPHEFEILRISARLEDAKIALDNNDGTEKAREALIDAIEQLIELLNSRR